MVLGVLHNRSPKTLREIENAVAHSRMWGSHSAPVRDMIQRGYLKKCEGPKVNVFKYAITPAGTTALRKATDTCRDLYQLWGPNS